MSDWFSDRLCFVPHCVLRHRTPTTTPRLVVWMHDAVRAVVAGAAQLSERTKGENWARKSVREGERERAREQVWHRGGLEWGELVSL